MGSVKQTYGLHTDLLFYLLYQLVLVLSRNFENTSEFDDQEKNNNMCCKHEQGGNLYPIKL